jgi:two-component system sensor histidine kinase AlgZ
MNTIAALVRKDPKMAEKAIEDLSDLFRAALGDENTHSTLADELQIAKQYLAIEQLRFGERLRMQWNLADDLPMHCRMPRLLLQPLLENAVVHGIALLAEGGEIVFSAKKDKQKLLLQVQNPIASEGSHQGFGHALDSVQRRIALFFGNDATLTNDVRNGVYLCTISLPYE